MDSTAVVIFTFDLAMAVGSLTYCIAARAHPFLLAFWAWSVVAVAAFLTWSIFA